MLYLLMLLAILVASPAAGSEGYSNQLSPRWSSWFAGHEGAMSLKPAAQAPYQATVTPTFYTRPTAWGSVRELVRDLERPRTEGLLASTTWLKGAFTTETEIAGNRGDEGGVRRSMSGDPRIDPSTRMLRLGVTGSSGSFRYGVRYREAGQAYYEGPDQGLREVWGEWKQGLTTITSAVGQQWNNVAGDPALPRAEQRYGRIGVSWSKPAGPTLSLTYSRRALQSTFGPFGIAPQNVDDHTVEAAVGYTGSFWQARLASGYSLQNDLLRHGESHVTTQTLTASFRPFNTLTIAPTLAYRAEQQEWSGLRINAPSASLAMNYRQSQRLLIGAMGNYSGMRSSDRLIDLEQVGGKGILAWDLQRSPDWATLLSLEGGYNRHINVVTPAAQMEDLSGILRLVLAPL
jgi:hypothetical protein